MWFNSFSMTLQDSESACHTLYRETAVSVTEIAIFFPFFLPLSLQDDLRTLFVTHGYHVGKDGEHKVMMPRQGFVRSCEVQSRWNDVPFTELNVTGWHFPSCSW